MSHGGNSSPSTPPQAPGWRRALGIVVFVVALALPLIALVVVPLLGLPSEVNAILFGLSLAGGPDVLIVAAVALLGRAGVEELMSRLGSVVKRITKWDAVTKTRYIIGLWVLVVSLAAPTVILFFWHDSIATIDGAPGWGFWVLLASTIAFIGAVLGMGAPLWARIEAIFTWEADIVLPESEN